MLVANAIERANSAKQKDIAGALELAEHFPGVSGSISFAPGVHIPEKEVTIVHIVGDKRTLATASRRKRSLLPRTCSRCPPDRTPIR
jgi:ABC-type branched-subunit amino acid transport system substrate-binding protein